MTAVASPVLALDLNEAFGLALSRDPRFAGMRFEREAEQEVLRQAWAGVLPTFSAEGVYTETSQDIISSDNTVFGSGKSDFPTTEYTLSLTQPLIDYAAFMNIKRAKALARGADRELAAARQDLAVRVATAYFAVLGAMDRLAATRAEEAAVSRNYELVDERFKQGLSTRTEYYDAKARLADVMANRLAVESDLDDARQALEEIIGGPAGELAPLREEIPLISPEPADAGTWIDAAVKQNPALDAAHQKTEAARQDIRRQGAAHYPVVNLEANHNWTETEGTLFGGGSEVETTEYLFRLTLPLYQGGVVSARTREAIQRLNASIQEEERQTRALERETRAAYFGVNTSIERVLSYREAVEAQRLAVEGKVEGHRSGLFTILAVLDGERDLSLARQNFAMARYDYIVNSLILKKTSGILGDTDIVVVNEWLKAQP
jgi:outer membrane protein